jgi:hypothetical protein
LNQKERATMHEGQAEECDVFSPSPCQSSSARVRLRASQLSGWEMAS